MQKEQSNDGQRQRQMGKNEAEGGREGVMEDKGKMRHDTGNGSQTEHKRQPRGGGARSSCVLALQ